MSDPVPSPAEKAAERALALLATPSRLAAVVRDRRNAALIDLFRSDDQRLSEQQISIMQRMMRRVIASIEDDLRARLVGDPSVAAEEELAASLASDRVPIAMPILEQSGLLRDTEFVAALLRRSDSFLLQARLGEIDIPVETTTLSDLVDRADSELAEAAMALLIAESRSNDRFGDPVLAVADLPVAVGTRLYWLIAAALREYGVRHHSPQMAAFDAAVETAGENAIEQHRDEEPVETAAMRVAQLLDRGGQLDDSVLSEAMVNCRLALYAAMLAMRADISFEAAWSMALCGDAGSHALVLRAAGAGAGIAHALIDAVGRASIPVMDHDIEAVGAIGDYESLSSADAKAALYPWRFDRGYRRAIDAVAGVSGGAGQ
ncbi:MAG: DUF2336 domain-containing protein [Sphingomonadaceae bacterium]|nr:DUF2336 domain-containing protein [Sphingomonadaceae bacterium]